MNITIYFENLTVKLYVHYALNIHVKFSLQKKNIYIYIYIYMSNFVLRYYLLYDL